MTHHYILLLSRTFYGYAYWIAAFFSLFINFQVTAQQSSLPCNATSSTPFTQPTFSSVTVTSDADGLGASVSASANLVDNSLTNSATAAFINVGIGAPILTNTASFTVTDGANTYKGGNFAGFALQSDLLNLSALGNITISTYSGSTLAETVSGTNLISVNSSLISGVGEVGFYTTKPYNSIAITIRSGVGLGSYAIYYAVMRGYCPTTSPLACNEQTRLNAPTFPVIVDPANTGFGGLLTVGSVTDEDNAISASTTDAASLALTGSVVGSGSFAIKLQDQVFDANTNSLANSYPAGTFAGIDISNPQLIGADLNTGMRVETYYQGAPTGDVAANGNLFVNGNTSLLTGTGRKLVGLIATKPFDEIKLTISRGTLSANVGTVLIYGAVVKRLCATTIACNTTYPLNNPAFPTVIDNARTGLSGLLGVALTIQDQENVVSSSTTDYAVITNTASAATTASIGVLDPINTYPGGTFAGFTVNKITGLTAATLFSRLTVTTYLDGNVVESRSGGDLLDLSVALFGASSGFFNVGFFSNQPFDEIQLSVAPFVDIAALSGQLRIYGAFIDTRSTFGGGLVCSLTTDPDFAVTNKNVPVSGNVSTNDMVPAGTTYGPAPAVTSQPNGSSPSLTVNADGTFTFSSATPGVYTYAVPVCVSSTCGSQTLTVTVLDPTINANNPVANPDVASTNGADANPASVAINVRANDQPGNQGGTLGTPTITTPPTSGSASVDGSGNVVYTPNPGFFGTDILTYQVCETPGTNLCSTATVTINVLTPGGANTTQAADDYISTFQGVAVSGNVKTNDTDPEGNTQTVTAQNTTVAGKGTLVLAADGSFTFTPVAGATGPVDFSYVVTDNGTPAASANGTLHVLINPFMPNPDFAVTTSNVPATGSVATNDMVPVGTTYGPTPTIISQPGNSTPTLTITSDGSYTFTSGTPGVYTYSVPVCTAGTASTCTAQTLTVTVLNATTGTAGTTNNPVANPDFVTTTGATNNPGSASVNITANDKPGNTGGTLQTPTIPSQPAHGTASIVNGNLVYTPNAGYFGVDVVTYQVCESPSTPSCATANVTITVVAPNSPTTVSINDDYVSTSGGPVSGNVLTNDLGTGLTVSNPGTTVTSSGTLVLTSSGSYTFTPTSGTTGPTTFTYTACDNNAVSTCGSATLHILVGQGIPDLTPTILINNLSFDPSSVGVYRDFIVNISEVKNAPTTGTVSFKVAKLTAFTITYSTTSGTSQVFNGVPNSNSDWTFSEDDNFITVQTNTTIAGLGNKIVGFSITRKAGVPPNTVQSINVTIAPNAGGETNFPNNVAVTTLAAN